MSDDDEATDYGRFTPEHEPDIEDELQYIILTFVREECLCSDDPQKLDSWGIYERAIEALARAGYVGIDRSAGRITATVTELGRNFEAWMKLDDRRKREAREAWELSETTPIPPGGPINTMKHRHLVKGVGFTKEAIWDILDRGQVPDWVPLIQAIRADPFGEIAENTLELCTRDLYAAPVFRRVIVRAQQVLSDEP